MRHSFFALSLLAILLSACNQKPEPAQDSEDFSERRAPVENALAQGGWFADPHHQSEYSFSPYGSSGIKVSQPATNGTAAFGNMTAGGGNSTQGQGNPNLVDMFRTIFSSGGQGNNSTTGSAPATNSSSQPPLLKTSNLDASETLPQPYEQGSYDDSSHYDQAAPLSNLEAENPQPLKVAALDQATSTEIPPLPDQEALKEKAMQLPEPELSKSPKDPKAYQKTNPSSNKGPTSKVSSKTPSKVGSNQQAVTQVAMAQPSRSKTTSPELAIPQTQSTDGSTLFYINGQPRFMKFLGTL